MLTFSISHEGGVDEDDVDRGGAVAIGLGGCLILSLIVDILGLSVLYLVALLSFRIDVCRSQHALGL